MIEVIVSDITRLDVDAIVNAANHSLLGGGGVDGAIHSAAGPELLRYNMTLGGCPTGEARISPGFNLKARHVISTVGPVWHGGVHGEPALLESCYESCLRLALDNHIKSIAFPGISTGIYGYPKDQAAKIAVSVMKKYNSQFERIIACCYSEKDSHNYLTLLQA